jgi:hypothetical protein
MQDANAPNPRLDPEIERRFLPAIYKMIETMARRVGGKKKLRALSGLTQDAKFLTGLANDPPRDERHAPDSETPPSRPTGEEHERARECAVRLLRWFEHWLHGCRA